MSDKCILELELHVASDAKVIAYNAKFESDHRLEFLCVTAEIGRLQKRVIESEGKTQKVIASSKLLCANVSSVTVEHDALAAKCKERALKVQFMPKVGGKREASARKYGEARGTALGTSAKNAG